MPKKRSEATKQWYKKYMREYVKKNLEKINARRRERWREKHPVATRRGKDGPDKVRTKVPKSEAYLPGVDNRRFRDPQSYLWGAAKFRAKRRGITFSIAREDILIPETCPYLGIPMEFGPTMHDGTPTLDRVDVRLGYVQGNVEVISWRANFLKNNISPDEAIKMANALLYRFT